MVQETAAACAGAPGVERAEADGQPGWVIVTLASNGQPADALMNDGLRAVIDASVPVLSFELEGARLSDAFLAMTEDAT
jgi:ABC-2 type transport system ATP-binding protein